MPVRYILSSVWIRLSIFSPLFIIRYVGLCVFSLPIPLVMNERIYILCLIIIIKSEVWTIIHCLGLGHETMVCAVCLSIFLLTCYSQGKSSYSINHQALHYRIVASVNRGKILAQPFKSMRNMKDNLCVDFTEFLSFAHIRFIKVICLNINKGVMNS